MEEGAEGADDAASPWASDDWEPGPRAPIEFARPPGAERAAVSPTPGGGPGAQAGDALAWSTDQPGDHDGAADERPHGLNSRLLVGCGAAALAVVAVVVFALTRPSAADDATERSAPDASASDSSPDSSTPRTTVPRTTVPRTTVPNTISVVVVPAGDERGDGESGDGADAAAPPPGPVLIAVEPEIAELELGVVPRWTEWRIPVTEPLASLAPTEVVFVGNRTLHRLELPSGTIRSLTLPAGTSLGGQITTSGDAILLPARSGVLVVRDGLPTVLHDLGGTVTSMRPRPSTGDLIASVQTDSSTGASRIVLVDADGTATPITHPRLAHSWPGGMAIGPTGALFVSDVGGVYSYDPATDTAHRVHDGQLLGSGLNHALVQTCDEALQCRTELVDLATWTAATVPSVFDDQGFGYDMPRLSPTGTHFAVASYRGSRPDLQVFEVASGTPVAGVDGSDLYMWFASGDVWASDGSGVFGIDAAGSLVFAALDGWRAEIDGFNSVEQLIVQAGVDRVG